MNLKIHHVGYLVKKIEKASKAFEKLGYSKEGGPVYDDHRDIDIVFYSKDGYRIELVSPRSERSVVYKLMSKYGNSPYHICYETDDLEKELDRLTNEGFVAWDEPHGAVAFDNRKVCFLIHPFMGMIELLDSGDSH